MVGKKLGLLILLYYNKSNSKDNQCGRATSRVVNTKVYGYKEYVDGVIICQKYSKSWYAILRA